jgi:hypothetical protein
MGIPFLKELLHAFDLLQIFDGEIGRCLVGNVGDGESTESRQSLSPNASISLMRSSVDSVIQRACGRIVRGNTLPTVLFLLQGDR